MKKRNTKQAEKVLEETLAGAPVQFTHCLQRVEKREAWLTVHPYTVNSIEMGVQEW